MDKNYANRLDYRRRILKDNHDIVVGVNDDDKIRPAVRELYQFVMATYLPQRYPTMFRVHQALWESGAQLMTQNLVTSRMFPAIPPQDMSTLQLLEILGQSLDEEFLLLLPEETTSEKDEPKYVLEAYICVCASGFNPREKLGKRLADIHGPVPSYPEKLEGSMDRFFEKLEVGKYVKRLNWTVTTDAELFATGKDTTHAYEGTKVEEMKEIEVDKVCSQLFFIAVVFRTFEVAMYTAAMCLLRAFLLDYWQTFPSFCITANERLLMSQTYLRSERQTLHRLPGSKALVFAFKTHLYPIAQIKEEGLGDELAEAIDGLKNGNAPQMHFYKRGTVWGEAAKRYLRS